jgi:hypothetical protein
MMLRISIPVQDTGAITGQYSVFNGIGHRPGAAFSRGPAFIFFVYFWALRFCFAKTYTFITAGILPARLYIKPMWLRIAPMIPQI